MADEMNKEVIDIDNVFNSIQNINEMDFTEIQKMGRGQTPEGIEQKCLDLCKDYLGGNWSQQTVDSIQVKRITGGLVNQIYQCSIREPNEREGIPQDVSIKIFGENPIDKNESRIKDLIISLVFSDKCLGPIVYGIFEGGIIQKHYKHRSFLREDQNNEVLLRKVGHTLASIHSLELPLKKYSEILKSAESLLNNAFEKHGFNEYIEEYNCETLKTYDLRTEFNWIKDVIQRLKCPILFTHNDYRSSNLMITEPNDELIVCDFDGSGYGYRGFDFSSLMREWGNRKQIDFNSIEDLPLNDEFRPFIEVYVEECIRIHGKSYAENPINSVDHILKEAKLFLLCFCIIMPIFVIKALWDRDGNPIMFSEPKLIMEFTENSLKNFITIKQIFISKKIFE